MSNILEFLFCPVHGVFRPDNVAPMIGVLQTGLMHFQLFLRKIGIL